MLEAGQTISHYTIFEKIGQGGMGVVYKARDNRLNRLVAIKTLCPDRVIDPERNHRFMREAQSASALNHPNIITIYEIDTVDQVTFIAMEYVKGRTIRDMMPAGGLGVGQALRYAVQIADALAALHSEGIIHRDLKPANIMVGEGASLKVLDFGLAKLTEDADPSEKSTWTTAEHTEDGIILGTVPYMSPEQVQGGPVDMRSDIFSFGVVLYEMISGRRPFRGQDRSSIAGSILNEEPVPISRIKSSVPPEIERTVSRCLEKDPQQRFQHAADLKIALEWLARDVDSGKLSAILPQEQPRNKRSLLWALAVILPVLLAAIAVIYRFSPKPQPTLDLHRVTSDLGLTTNPTLSLDGKLLAYSSDRGGDGNLDIWLQQLAGGQPIRRTHDPRDEESPRFSPDGSSIVFIRVGDGIFITPSLAGEERQIAPSGLHPRFSPDGSRIAYWVGDEDNPAPSGKVYCANIGSGVPVQIGPEFADGRYPIWAPDGKHILFQGVRSPLDDPEWWVAPVDPGPVVNTRILSNLRRRQLSPVQGPGDWIRNYLVFSAETKDSRHIWIGGIKTPGFQFAGIVRQLTFGTGTEGEPSIASDGRLALSGWYYQNNLWRLSLRSTEADPARLERISETGASDTNPSVSASSGKLAFLSRRSGVRQVWIRDLQEGAESSLTVGTGDKSTPVIAPNGSWVAYSLIEGGKPSIYVVSSDNARPGEARRVCENCGTPSDWTPDSNAILGTSGLPKSVFLLDLGSGTRVPVIRDPKFNLDQPHVSPDGRWIAFVTAISSERARIFLSPLRRSDVTSSRQWIAVTDGQSWDDKPRWIDGNTLIYYSNRDHFGCLWKQQLQRGTMEPVGNPVAAHHFHELRRSPRTLHRSDFDIALMRDSLILNLVEITGNIWLTSLPMDE